MKITKRLNICLLVFVWLGLVSSNTNAQEQLADLVARIRPSVVTIITFDKDGNKLMRGSGFCVATNQIITNKHVLKNSSRSEIMTADGYAFRVLESVGMDEDGDLVLLKTEPLLISTKPLTISKVSPRAGDKIFIIGNPLGLEGTVSDGIVSAFREMRGIGKLIQITAPISPGSSGSPVVNIWGEVVGVATLNLEGGQNLNFAISSERILSLWPGLLTTSNSTQSSLPTTSAVRPIAKGISGYWKTSNGGVWKIEDDGETVLVKNYIDNDNYDIEAKWTNDLALGVTHGRYQNFRFVIKAVDSTHIWFRAYYIFNLNDSPEKTLKQATKNINKEHGIWTKIQ